LFYIPGLVIFGGILLGLRKMEKNGEKMEKGGVEGEPWFPSKYKFLVILKRGGGKKKLKSFLVER
jgi:hypothetical protein